MHYESFGQATTIYDIICLVLTILMLVSMYACYRWGFQNGYKQGSRDRRLADRKIRRGEMVKFRLK